MDYWSLINPSPGHTVLASTDRSQATTLVLAPGDRIGGTDNVQPSSDLWIYVLAGEGRAAVADQAMELGPGSLVLIEAGESHEVSNTGDTPLETITIYAPTVY